MQNCAPEPGRRGGWSYGGVLRVRLGVAGEKKSLKPSNTRNEKHSVMPSERQPIVELRHVQRRFIKDRQVIPVIQDIDLSVYEREILCIVGESGCGKTTTGKMIAGLLKQSDGDILVNGRPLASYKGREAASLRRDLQ